MNLNHLEASTKRQIKEEWRLGWRAVLGSSIGMGTGVSILILCASLFLMPMHQEFGGSMKAVTFVPIIAITMSLTGPLAGMLVDRWGSRPVGMFGLLYLAVGLFVLAAIPANPAALLIVAILMGIGAPASSVVPYTRCVASWFRLGAGSAFGVTMNGVAIVSLVAVPLLSWVIQTYGWRSGFVTLGVLVILLGLPITMLFVRDRPTIKEMPSDIEPGASPDRLFLKDIRFWSMFGAFTLAAVPLGGFMAHFHSILANGGVPAAAATGLGMVYLISIIVGRLGGGLMLDLWNDGGVALVLLALAAAGGFLLGEVHSGPSIAIVVVAAFLVGMGQGAEGDFLAYFTLKIFGLKRYSTIIGIYVVGSGVGLAAGGLGFSALYDQHGNYALACISGAAFYLLAGLIIFATRICDGKLRPSSLVNSTVAR